MNGNLRPDQTCAGRGFLLAVCGRCRSWAIVAPFGHHCPVLVVGTHEQTSSARHVRAFFSSENNGALTELRRHRSSHGMNEPVRFEMRLPPALRAELTRAAAVENRSVANMARHLIARGLEPLNGAEKATFGHDAQRSPVTGRPYESGSGALPRELQDKLVAAEAAAGRRLSEPEAQLLLHGDPVETAVAAAVKSIEDLES
jgi:hypothetical protein